MKQLLLRLWYWLGRLLGASDSPGYKRETDGLPILRLDHPAYTPRVLREWIDQALENSPATTHDN